MKTLVIEDDLMSQCLLAKVLTERGHEVVTYENAEQAVLAYQREFYPLVFVDAGLPGMGGLQFAKWVRSQPNGDRVFLMVATAPGQPADLTEVLSVGANDFIPKPYEGTSLHTRLAVAEREMNRFFEIKALEHSLNLSRKESERLATSTQDGIWLLDPRLLTVSVNPRLISLLGLKPADVEGRPAADFIVGAEEPGLRQWLDSQPADGPSAREVCLRLADGSASPALVSSTPVVGDDGTLQGALWMVTDLAALRRTEAELAETKRTSESRITELSSQLNATSQELEAETAVRKQAEQARVRLEKNLEAESTARAATASELERTSADLGAQVQALGKEAARLGQALEAEQSSRARAETTLASTRQELEGRIHALQAQKITLEADLKATQAGRAETAAELERHRTESAHAAARHATAEGKWSEERATALAERSRLEQALAAIQADLERRTTEHSAAVTRLSAELQQAGRRADDLDRDLARERGSLADLQRKHSEAVSELERRIETAGREHSNSVEAALKTRQALETRAASLEADLARVQEENSREKAGRSEDSADAAKVRADLLRQIEDGHKQSTGLVEKLAKADGERERLAAALTAAQADMAARVHEHVESAAKAESALQLAASARQQRETEFAAEQVRLKSLLEQAQTQYESLSVETRQVKEALAARSAEIDALSAKLKAADEAAVVARAAFIQDTSDRTSAEGDVHRLAAFPRLNPDPVVGIDSAGAVTYANQSAEQLASSLGLATVAELLPPDRATVAQECLENGRGRAQRELTVGNRVLSWSFFPVPGGQVVYGYATDITQRREIEARLGQGQKYDSISQLAAGVAHDFNNQLSVIQGYAAMLQDNTAAGVKVDPADALRQIAGATDRAAHLTRQLLTFSRRQALTLRTEDLNELLDRTSGLLRSTVGDTVSLACKYSPGDLPVDVDAGGMEQVMVNLALNAREAMPCGGNLTLTTAQVDLDAERAARNPESRPGRFACVTVADTGSGMDVETLRHLFEPFFTTKPRGKGAGLGLATAYGIVRQHKGWIEVESEPGRGTQFRVYLPVASRAPIAADVPARATASGGRETILLVEDEPAVLVMARGILQRLGYTVIESPSGDDALKLWEKDAPQVDLLLTDVVMPGTMSGPALADRLRAEQPALKVIFSSGYSIELVDSPITVREESRFLQKPYTPDALAKLVRQCLDGHPA